MKELEEYDYELDPPSMMEFNLFRRLGNMLDMYDRPHAWSDLQVDEELCEVADLLEEAGKKYDTMLSDYYKGQKESQ
jgi:hypothetical protein